MRAKLFSFMRISSLSMFLFVIAVAVMGHVLLTLSISPFRSSHRKCSIKKAAVEVLNIHRKTRMLEFLFNKVQG